MFGHRYFGTRYYGQRYFGGVGAALVVVPDVEATPTTGSGGSNRGFLYKKKYKKAEEEDPFDVELPVVEASTDYEDYTPIVIAKQRTQNDLLHEATKNREIQAIAQEIQAKIDASNRLEAEIERVAKKKRTEFDNKVALFLLM